MPNEKIHYPEWTGVKELTLGGQLVFTQVITKTMKKAYWIKAEGVDYSLTDCGLSNPLPSF